MDNEHNAPMQVDPSTHPVSAIQAFKLDPSTEWVIESAPGFIAIKHKMGCPICDALASHCMATKRSYEIRLDEKEVTDAVAEAWPKLVSDIPASDGEDDDEDLHGLPTLPEEIPQDPPSRPPTRIVRPMSKPRRKDTKIVPEAGLPAIGSSRFPNTHKRIIADPPTSITGVLPKPLGKTHAEHWDQPALRGASDWVMKSDIHDSPECGNHVVKNLLQPGEQDFPSSKKGLDTLSAPSKPPPNHTPRNTLCLDLQEYSIFCGSIPPIPPPTYVATLVKSIAFNEDSAINSNWVVGLVRKCLQNRHPELLSFCGAYHEAIKVKGKSNAKFYLNKVLDTLRIKRFSLTNSGFPMNLHEKFDIWKDLFERFNADGSKQAYFDLEILGKVPVLHRRFTCLVCKGLDHPTAECKYPSIPGWPKPVPKPAKRRAEVSAHNDRGGRGGRAFHRGGGRGRRGHGA
ncbi:hypothetical protein M422DRAFT_251641 [Sphaerobolus stellatus SS14]|uniref:Uncharacterized protein n=1 Tax=Sphaerobolus stellatus (strain SS14) TaxID=990650 RepID=A0A0C9W0N6_SPHS4|nr:hypothetical protein M422DRAFT_251641 [Sphaerobolus stellatus SS14]